MPWNLDSTKPIYLQLMDTINSQIVSGKYKPGDKLPSVRDLALEASVNPNTMQKALYELERSGILVTNRTSGRYVTDNPDIVKRSLDSTASKTINQFISDMNALGYPKAKLPEMIENYKN